ncbi:hypothetical protein WA026_003376 [Henosepilachna vigintioctopunctata]|uniref:Uncharacterized protein n=1 Tax=Henosepilachna vigintioctopunctata TaxID=420089 RepID=A0AAW1TN59_9CUCU
MVKVRDEPEIEPQNGSRKFPLIQQPLPMNSNPLKACNNQNHLHQHRIYHHYTYYHHYSINQSETDVLSSGSGDSAAPKFYFGPGFEPQASGTGGCAVHDQARPGNDPKNQEYVVLFHVNPGVTISFQIGDTTEILRGFSSPRDTSFHSIPRSFISCIFVPPIEEPIHQPTNFDVIQVSILTFDSHVR